MQLFRQLPAQLPPSLSSFKYPKRLNRITKEIDLATIPHRHPMFLTETSPLSPFHHAGKRFPAKNLDLIAKSFDEALLRRLKPLILEPSSINLSWLSVAVDLLSSTHADAEALISDLKSISGSETSLKSYVDDSVKVLDLCNFITSEIERFQKSRLLMSFVLHLLDFSSGEPPPSDRLRRVRISLSDWVNLPPPLVVRKGQNPAVLIRELAERLANSSPHGKISTVGKLVERTTYAVGAVTVFVTSVTVAVSTESREAVQVRVPSEFLWADSFNALESDIFKKLSSRVKNGQVIGELGEVDVRVKSICHVIDEVAKRNGGVVSQSDREPLECAVKELAKVAETLSDGLDRLSNNVNGFFHTVLCTRNSFLQNFRVGAHLHKGK